MRKLIAGNWKMHGWRESWRALAEDIADAAHTVNADLVLCPPFVALSDVEHILSARGGHVALGAQDAHPAKDGAFTGDISAHMLKDMKCRYVIVGHSERRAHHHETNADVAAKAVSALACGLRPIVCVGEAARTSTKETNAFLTKQLTESLNGVEVARGADLVVAYEPVWAIGSGQTPTVDDIRTVMTHLRGVLQNMMDEVTGRNVRLLYGGSVNPSNARDILELTEVDGALVGGASLKAESFLQIAGCLQKAA